MKKYLILLFALLCSFAMSQEKFTKIKTQQEPKWFTDLSYIKEKDSIHIMCVGGISTSLEVAQQYAQLSCMKQISASISSSISEIVFAGCSSEAINQYDINNDGKVDVCKNKIANEYGYETTKEAIQREYSTAIIQNAIMNNMKIKDKFVETYADNQNKGKKAYRVSLLVSLLQGVIDSTVKTIKETVIADSHLFD